MGRDTHPVAGWGARKLLECRAQPDTKATHLHRSRWYRAGYGVPTAPHLEIPHHRAHRLGVWVAVTIVIQPPILALSLPYQHSQCAEHSGMVRGISNALGLPQTTLFAPP